MMLIKPRIFTFVKVKMSSKTREVNGYRHDLELAIGSH